MDSKLIRDILRDNREQVKDFGIKALYLFGSVVRNEATEASDIDLLIEFEDDVHIGLFGFARLQRMLTNLLGCKVDLVTKDSLHKALRDRILKEVVYAL